MLTIWVFHHAFHDFNAFSIYIRSSYHKTRCLQRNQASVISFPFAFTALLSFPSFIFPFSLSLFLPYILIDLRVFNKYDVSGIVSATVLNLLVITPTDVLFISFP